MLWVDHASYFGPDRRRKPGGMRIRERRRYDYAGNPPPLPTALRQLRMRVLEAQGPGAAVLSDRARGAAYGGEDEAAQALSIFAATALRGRNAEVRQLLYHELDHVHAVLRNA